MLLDWLRRGTSYRTHRSLILREAVIVSPRHTGTGRAFHGALNNIKSANLAALAPGLPQSVPRQAMDWQCASGLMATALLGS